jgi:predicted nucleic acid-binding protein
VVERVAVDANVLLSHLTDRNAKQQEQASRLLASASEGELELHLPQAAMSDVVFVMEKSLKVPVRRVAELVGSVLTLPGARPVHELDWRELFSLWPETISSYGDALVLATARAAGSTSIATFDLALRRQMRKAGFGSYW